MIGERGASAPRAAGGGATGFPAELWRGCRINPLTKVAILVAVSTLAFASPGRNALYVCLAASAFVALAGGGAGAALKAQGFLLSLVVVERYVSARAAHPLLVVLGGFLHTLLRMGPAILLATWLVASVQVSDLIAAAEACRIPRSVTIALAVTLRYLPTIAFEMSQISSALRTRGRRGGLPGFLRSPVGYLEERMVPLLLRSLVVADELSASAVTRGLDAPGRRSSARPVPFRAADAAALVACAAFCSAVSRYLHA